MRSISILFPAALSLALACDGGGWLDLHAAPSFREVGAAEGHSLAARPGVHLLQAGTARGRAVAGALQVEPEGNWPEEAADGAPVVILAPDEQAGYRLAARMARSGIQGVVLVSGGLDAWLARENEPDEIAATERRTQRE